MDAFENGLELKPSHTIGNDMCAKNINKFGPMKLNVGYFIFNGHSNQNFNIKTFNS
jgi:hypothetical protein